MSESALFNYCRKNWRELVSNDRLIDYLSVFEKESIANEEHGHLIEYSLRNMTNPQGDRVGQWGVKRILNKMRALSEGGLLALQDILIKHGALIEKGDGLYGDDLEGDNLKQLSEELHKLFPYRENEIFRHFAGGDYNGRVAGGR